MLKCKLKVYIQDKIYNLHYQLLVTWSLSSDMLQAIPYAFHPVKYGLSDLFGE